VIAIDAGSVRAERIARPRSLPNRYVLHLHGGAYLLGFPALFRDFTWRIADAACARVLCIDYRLAEPIAIKWREKPKASCATRYRLTTAQPASTADRSMNDRFGIPRPSGIAVVAAVPSGRKAS
jgi:hypothetical protein